MAFDPTKDYITREEQFLTVMAGNSDINFPEPITRFEHYLAAMCDSDNYPAPAPITRLEHYLSAIAQKISEGGGGGGGLTLLASGEYSVNTTSTSATKIAELELPYGEYGKNDIIFVHIRDKAGKRTGYFYGSDTMFFSFQLANGNTNSLSVKSLISLRANSEGNYAGIADEYGVYAYSLYYTSSYHYVRLNSRYSASSSGTIDGTFKVDVYKLSMPDGFLWEAEEPANV